jgi:hypothetical protein
VVPDARSAHYHNHIKVCERAIDLCGNGGKVVSLRA